MPSERTIPSQAGKPEGVTTIAQASTTKRWEAPRPLQKGEDIVCSAWKQVAAERRGKSSELAGTKCSDFGNLSVVPNRFQRQGDAFVLDPEYAAMVYLRPYKQEALAKTGDNEKRMLITEWGLKIKQEKAHGLITDLTPSACVGTTDSCADSGSAS